MKNKQSFSFEASAPHLLLNHWSKVFNGRVEGDKIILPEGIVCQYQYDLFNILTVNVRTERYIEMERKFTQKSWFPIVISNNVRKFEAIPEHRNVVSGGYVFTNINGITRYSPGDIKLVIIHLSLEAMHQLLPENSHLLPVFNHRESYFFEDVLTAEMLLAYQKIIHNKGDRNYIRAYTWIILAEIFNQIGKTSSIKQKSTIKQLNITLKAERLLLENLSEPKPLESIADECGVSYSYLRRAFGKIYQTTMHQYLHSYRMEQAKIYLQTGDKNISEVAYMVGYNHLGHFSDEFKKYFGKLPSQFLFGHKHNL